MGNQIITSTPVHPQANGLAQSSMKIIIKHLKDKKGRWAKELPMVLWADMITTKGSNEKNSLFINIWL